MDYENPLDVQLDLKNVVRVRATRPPAQPKPVVVEEEGDSKIAEFSDPEIHVNNEELFNLNTGDGLDSFKFSDDLESNLRSLEHTSWGTFDVTKIIDALIKMGELMTGNTSLPYQLTYEKRVYRSILTNSSRTITYQVSRQAGKTMTNAKIVVVLCTVLPTLSKIFPKELGRFSKGFFVGVFAPIGEQSTTLYDRIKDFSKSQEAALLYEDPDIDITVDRRAGCKWSNGSRVYMRTASPKAKIESLTLHLAVIDEAQQVDKTVVNKSIKPMLGWNNGLSVMIGTCDRDPGIFYEQIQLNKKLGMSLPRDQQLHFEYTYEEVLKYNPMYKLYVDTAKADMGEDSPDFQMAYLLKWMFERDKPFTAESIKLHTMRYERDIVRTTSKPVIIGIDIAAKRYSTVVTATEILNVQSVVNGQDYDVKCTAAVCDWLEIEQTPHPQQRPLIKNFISRYDNVMAIVVDATGVGDPILEQMMIEWPEYSKILIPYIFHPKSKAQLSKILDDYFFTDRLLIPNSPAARATKRHQNFYFQLLHITSVSKDGYSYYSKNEKIRVSKDDYFDSLCLSLYGVDKMLKSASKYDVAKSVKNPMFRKSKDRVGMLDDGDDFDPFKTVRAKYQLQREATQLSLGRSRAEARARRIIRKV